MAASLAPAKVNLCLHMTGIRADGYHLLDGLVAFTDFGDRVSVHASDDCALTLAGPMAPAIAAEPAETNLAMVAARRFAAAFDALPVHITLDKHIPVAAGLGGGAADAAAVLRLLAEAHGVSLDDPALTALALEIGADVPVCLGGTAARMQGIGEILSPLPPLPDLAVVLVNPRVAVSSGAVFKAYDKAPVDADAGQLAQAVSRAAGGCNDAKAFIAALADTSNHLTAAAEAIAPEIRDVLAALSGAAGCGLARMSGSGATCFGLFANRSDAQQAETDIAARCPTWWTMATRLRRSGP